MNSWVVSRLVCVTLFLGVEVNAMREERAIGNYTVILDSSLAWNQEEAQQYCQDEYGTSLASFHSNEQWEPVMQEILSMRSDYGDRYYLIGMRCWNYYYSEVDGKTGPRFSNISNLDGTQFDYLLKGALFSPTWLDRWCGYFNLRVQSHVTRRISSLDDNARYSGLICNSISDAEWQQLNPPRTDYLQCDEDNRSNCRIECTMDSACVYYTNHSLSGFQSLSISCTPIMSCYGMNIVVSDSDNFSFINDEYYDRGPAIALVRVPQIDFSGAIHEGLLSIRETENASVICATGIVSCTNSWFYFSQITGDATMSCEDRGVCSNSEILWMDEVDRAVINCTGSNEYESSCESTQFSIDGATEVSVVMEAPDAPGASLSISNSEQSTITCANRESCKRMSIAVQNTTNVDISCLSDDSCSKLGLNTTNVGSLSVICDGERSCEEWETDQQSGIVEVAKFDCKGRSSCVNTDSVTAVDLSVWCTGESSCEFKYPSHSDSHPTATVEGLTVHCEGDFSCPQRMMDFMWNYTSSNSNSGVNLTCTGFRSCYDASILGPRLSVACEGNEACTGSSLAAKGGGLEVVCSDEGNRVGGSCDGITVNGLCSSAVSVELERHTTVKDMAVVCPNNGAKDSHKCAVTVRGKAKMEEGSISMRPQDWAKDRYRIRSKGDGSFVRVTTEDFEDGNECPWMGDASSIAASVGCFLEEIGDSGEWEESGVCRDFVMNLYSPVSVMVLSLTTLLGTVFIFQALNQLRESPAHWALNCLLGCLAITNLFALMSSLSLQNDESRVRSSIENNKEINGDVIGAAFPMLASLNLVGFVGLLSSWMLCLIPDSLGWRKSVLCVCLLRMLQMLVVYVVLSAQPSSHLICFILFICSDSLVLLFLHPKHSCIPLLSTCLAWLLISQFSPLSWVYSSLKWYRSRSFFEVMSDSQFALLWFDSFLCEISFGIVSLIVLLKGRNRIATVAMFLQLLDYSTDMAVIIFWLSNGKIFWAVCEALFIISAALLSWKTVRHRLMDWTGHFLFVSGLGRGYIKIKVWHNKDKEWHLMDHTVGTLESYYESQPSIILGVWLLMSDLWQGNSNTLDLGPLITSMFISGLSVGFNIAKETQIQLISESRIQADFSMVGRDLCVSVSVFLFHVSDFICRSTPMCVALALAQGRDVANEQPSGALIGVLLALIAVFLAEQTVGIYYASRMDAQSKEVALIYALPSIFTGSAMFYGCFGIEGLPQIFSKERFFHVHWLTLCMRTVLLISCLSSQPVSFRVFKDFLVLWVVVLVVNVGTGLFIKYKTQWS